MMGLFCVSVGVAAAWLVAAFAGSFLKGGGK